MRLLLLLLICPLMVRSQLSIAPIGHGTYIVAGITKDGIVICTDSRSVFFDNNKRIAAYCDESNKINSHHDVVVAVSGSTGMYTMSIDGMFKKFKEAHPSNIPLRSFYDVFVGFCKTLLSPAEFEELKSNQFFICGYDGGAPYVYFYEAHIKKVLTKGLITSSAKEYRQKDFQDAKLLFPGYSMDQGIKFAYTLVKSHIEYSNKDTVGVIGGIPCLVTINRSNISWIYEPFDRHLSISDFANKLHAGKIKMHYRSNSDKKEFLRVMGRYTSQPPQ